MQRTFRQQIPYPLGLDGANGARQIQDTAERLEAIFTGFDARYREALSPPSWLARTTSADSSSTGFINFAWDAVDFDSGHGLAPINNGTTAFGSLAPDGVWETWHVGGFAQFTGGTTLGAELDLRMTVREVDTVSGLITDTVFTKSGAISLNSGDYLCVSGTVRVKNAAVFMEHSTKGAGTRQIASGALLWAARVGREV